ncbi:PEP-CTERM sorting domain-containing protein [Azohydromonas lata]|uniref:PEP-CTERM sorting domain-containing protein n=1 Tax=Azohydromonas lata TaxID=45677 RepID=A0ABU5IIR1_9BURK|nr:PEP-CTERM sorting domain-containing protein [Azohydromonas lata]MDZ5458610.1 PEP-CTERM sorting domain-containing protein [Azohydromonas lata]
MHFKLVTIAAAVAGMAAGTAQADIRLSARINDFGYQLTDLRPSDGMAPSLDFGNAGYYIDLNAAEGPYAGFRDNQMKGSSATKIGLLQENLSITRAVSSGRSDAAFGISGALSSRSFEWFVSGNAVTPRGNPVQASLVQLQAISGQPGLYWTMTVAPYTQVTWSGTLTLEAAQTQGKRGARYEEMNLSGGLSLLDENREIIDGLGRFIRIPRGTVDSQHNDYEIDMVFSNHSAAARHLILEGGMSGMGQSFFPVPEPNTVAMMLSGMGILVGVVCRRRRQA